MPTVAAARAAIVAQIVDGAPNSITPTKLRSLLTDLCDALDAETPFSKLDATAAPTPNDDSADTSGNGVFEIGSIWIDVSNDEAYRCVDATSTAAVWINTTLTTSELGALALLNTVSTSELASPTGSDTNVVTGTAGTSGNVASWDANGDAVDSGIAAANVLVDADIGVALQAYDAELAALAGLTSAANKVPYFTGSETAGLLDFVDEDNMASDSATAVPSQQSVKAYVDANAVAISAWSEKTSTYTAVDGDRLIADTVTTSAFTINLPATPSTGAHVTIIAGSDFDTNNLTIGRNGSTIMAAAADMTVDANIKRLEFVYDGATWRVG